MEHVLSLIGAPGKANVTSDSAARVAEILDGLGARIEGASWLAPGDAWEARFSVILGETVRDAVARAFLDEPIDINVVRAGGRRKQLLIADMDSTMITTECIDELAIIAGIGDQIAEITVRTMAGELNFTTSLLSRIELLEGLDESALEQAWSERTTLMPGGKTLVGTMKANGTYAALVSGGFTYFTERVADMLGFDDQRANQLKIEKGKLTGEIQMPVLGRAAKLEVLNELCTSHKLEPDQVLAVGDGANDLDMIGAAGMGVAFRAKPVVAAAASAAITHGDLTGLLYLQGYARSEFVSPKSP